MTRSSDHSDPSRGAEISADGVYRYRLWRRWDDKRPSCTWIMLNPSTADGLHDDPTIRRCIGFATRWGFGRIDVFNLFGLRATDPRELLTHPNPIGPANDARLLKHVCALDTAPYWARTATLAGASPWPIGPIVMCAWGANRAGIERGRELLHELHLHGVHTASVGAPTLNGHPRHPLYLPGIATPAAYPAKDAI